VHFLCTSRRNAKRKTPHTETAAAVQEQNFGGTRFTMAKGAKAAMEVRKPSAMEIFIAILKSELIANSVYGWFIRL
jgi:hypothetical protein